jgi:ribosomal protein L30
MTTVKKAVATKNKKQKDLVPQLILKQTGSAIRCTERQRQNLKGLGLRRIGHVRVLSHTPATYGMFLKVSHIVERLLELPGETPLKG